MSAPTIDDYPHALVADGRPGEERRRTIDDIAVNEASSDPDRPLVSIITVVFNNRRHLDRAMQSVFAQSYRNIEYIVIDGGSTDGTVELIRSHAGRLSYWHSAPDKGISDAFNMGVALARGDYVGLVNSDDWMSPDQVEQGVRALKASNSPFVFGDLIYYDAQGRRAYRIAGDPGYPAKLWHRMPQVTHPTALVRSSTYARHGLFDPRWKIGMDYDWLLRLNDHGLVGSHTPAIVGNMSLGGVSDRHWRQCLDEHCAIAVGHGGSPLILRSLLLIRKIKIGTRQRLEKWLPRKVIVRLRAAVNSSFEGVD